MNFSYRVYYEDTDAGGVVYHANYLKFFERARTDFLRLLGISQSELAAQEKLIFVMRKCDIEYSAPAKLDDLIEVSVAVKQLRASSVLIYQEAKKSEKILTRLHTELVCVDSDSFKPKKIPQNIKNLLHVR
jgi:acyl-CoA thioester hydrolase